MSEAGREFVLTVSCPDRTGITHAVSGVALENDLSIADSQQFADPTSGEFHLRMHLTRQGEPTDVETVRESFARVVEEFDVTPSEFWAACGYLTRLGQANEVGLLVPGLGVETFLDVVMELNIPFVRLLRRLP